LGSWCRGREDGVRFVAFEGRIGGERRWIGEDMVAGRGNGGHGEVGKRGGYYLGRFER
jgi:hypothetical protein